MIQALELIAIGVPLIVAVLFANSIIQTKLERMKNNITERTNTVIEEPFADMSDLINQSFDELEEIVGTIDTDVMRRHRERERVALREYHERRSREITITTQHTNVSMSNSHRLYGRSYNIKLYGNGTTWSPKLNEVGRIRRGLKQEKAQHKPNPKLPSI